jgi:RNA polymerase sigma-70 factor (ECF subfamily)
MTGTPKPEWPDDTLVRRAVEDPGGPVGRAAASELLGRYQGRVYLWCYRYVRDHDRAMDLAQDALLSAYRALATFQGRSRFSSWLFAIARNRCLTAVAPPSLVRDEGVELDALPDPGDSVERSFDSEQGEARLLELIRTHLDAEEQEALWLRCVERVPVEEITEILGNVSASGARGVLQRARRKLRAALDRKDDERNPTP